MSDISDEAQDLLITLKRISKIRTMAGDFIDKRSVLLDHGYKQNGKELDHLFTELTEKGYLKYQSGAHRLLAKALNQTVKHSSSVVNNNFSGISNSNIANMSSYFTQNLDLSSYSDEVQKEVAELQEAVKVSDDTRAKRIIDGLWVSAPALVLSMIQIGLSAYGGGK